ncbi:MBL fold metallo-hydrolase [Rhodococcus koreensis]|jgi:glyoxylase-like metal-dependent hydrolase (beta-lactamase superfamily II)|uniref:MBL fold metallo-hydrolase n=1 Tax=Rhodococcus koreensis TaxID=99653 RepID=UPI0019823075|nr:MBL fold metallo-hydrolase [Rhodococcus koreensis]QSE86719.1 MBL fold metallo-hydrolase [Rhodococcus koreensis]
MSEDLDVSPLVQSWSVGTTRITSVLEMAPQIVDPARFIQTDRSDVRQIEWLFPDFADEDGSIKLNFQIFVIEAGNLRIVVDPCFGNDKQRKHTSYTMLKNPLLERLESAGFHPDTIDYVVCTHLHADHCGWNTVLANGIWVPTFANAQYLITEAEYEHAANSEYGDAQAVLADSVTPIVIAGLARFVDPSHVICEGVCLEPTPGHTPGHCSVFISSEGREAIITGDLIHHPIQLAFPQVGDNFCWNSVMSENTRRRILGRAADSGALLLGSHFSGPVGIYVQPDGTKRRGRTAHWQAGNNR